MHCLRGRDMGNTIVVPLWAFTTSTLEVPGHVRYSSMPSRVGGPMEVHGALDSQGFELFLNVRRCAVLSFALACFVSVCAS
jgi:hypothetical protein